MKTLFLLVLIGAMMTTPIDAHEVTPHVGDTIAVTGFGEIEAEPDMAVLSLTVSALNKDVSAAKAEADLKYKSVVAVIKKNGVDEKFIKLSRLNITPEYQWSNNSQQLIGTRVSRSLAITINDLSGIPLILQELVEEGVSTIDNISTDFKQRNRLQRQALELAIVDAKEKAEFLAQQFDKQLGATYTIAESQTSRPSYRSHNDGMIRSKSMSMDAPPQERFGSEKIRAQIHVVFHSN